MSRARPASSQVTCLQAWLGGLLVVELQRLKSAPLPTNTNKNKGVLPPANCDQVGHYQGDLPEGTSGNVVPSFFSHGPLVYTAWAMPWERCL